MKKTLPRLAVGLIFALLAGCASSPSRATRSAGPPLLRAQDYSETVRVACVGDSITYGAGVEDQAVNNYPAVLGRLLGDKFTARNFGVSGATLLKKGDKPYWSLPEFQAVADYNPHAIVIKLGTNDSKPQNWRHAAEFAADLRAMIDHFRALPARPRIWLCLPVPVYESRWGINEAVVGGQVIPHIKQVADEKNVPVIDLYVALSEKADFFPDKIHPNTAGARVIAQTIYAALTGKQP